MEEKIKYNKLKEQGDNNITPIELLESDVKLSEEIKTKIMIRIELLKKKSNLNKYLQII